MKRFAHVKNGIIETISEAESVEFAFDGIELDQVEHAEIGIGDLYNGSTFSKPAPPPKTLEEKRKDVDRQRDAALVAGCSYNGKVYPFDDVMIAAITGRLVRWNEGRIPVDAKLPVRLKDNSIVLLSRLEHLDLADALSSHGENIYAASWAAKDAL